MPFTKGKSGNPAGRSVSAHAKALETRRRMAWFIDDRFEVIMNDFDNADAIERRRLYALIAPFVLSRKDSIPFHKMEEADLDVMIEAARTEFERLTKEKEEKERLH